MGLITSELIFFNEGHNEQCMDDKMGKKFVISKVDKRLIPRICKKFWKIY